MLACGPIVGLSLGVAKEANAGAEKAKRPGPKYNKNFHFITTPIYRLHSQPVPYYSLRLQPRQIECFPASFRPTKQHQTMLVLIVSPK